MENLLKFGLLALVVIVVMLILWLSLLNKKIKTLTAGKSGLSLEKIIIDTHTMIRELQKNQTKHEQDINHLKHDITKTIQHIPIIRFDALREMGGMQSFAIGLLDSHKNGVVLSSMYTRDRMHVFAKEIVKGESKHTLTDEEKKIINL